MNNGAELTMKTAIEERQFLALVPSRPLVRDAASSNHPQFGHDIQFACQHVRPFCVPRMSCSLCHYSSPNAPPSCEVCGSKFPACELGEWLTYQRAEPEWTVNEWLTGAPEVQKNVVQPDGLSSDGHQTVAEVEDQPQRP